MAGDSPTIRDADDSFVPRAEADRLLVAGRGQLRSFKIVKPELVIGRAPECDVMIDHGMLSRRHAVLRVGPPASVRDLGSTNGTHVATSVRTGGDAVVLDEGDSFRIGPFSFVVLRGRGATRAPDGPSVHDLMRIEDPAFSTAPEWLDDIAASKLTVLLLGETGVGKELLADTIHRRSGRTGPFLRINCAALSESLLESELFGHDKGAFTGAVQSRAGLLESAQGGTVFFDEIGELPPAIQAKLLRAIESREVTRLGTAHPISIDVRFVAATNRDLAAEVAAGRFRQDLYFRLDGISLSIPPLRERRAMIVPLALDFLEAARAKPGDAAAKLDGEAIAMLEAHDWPGNVRELKAAIERAVVLARGGTISARHLSLARRPPSSENDLMLALLAGLSAEDRDDRARIIDVLEQNAGNQSRAAKALGVSRATLVTKLQRYRIPRPRDR
jgi:two-component system, NtrC family, response regulator AtoC